MYIFILNLDTISALVATIFSLQIFRSLFPGKSLTLYTPPLDDLGPSFVDHLDHYLSACPIKHLPKPLVSCGSQENTVQESFPHKYNQEVWWDALNMGAATSFQSCWG